MNSISINYVLKYQLDFAENYKWTEKGMCFNSQTNREIKKVVCGRSIGYCIKGRFYALSTLRKHLVKIEKIRLPF